VNFASSPVISHASQVANGKVLVSMHPARSILLFALVVLAGSSIARADNVDGAWSPVFDWPLISVHAAITPDMRVLTYGTKGNGQQTGYFIYDVWDASEGPSGDGHLTLDNMTLTDLFCSSQVILPQSGEIFIAGGDNWTGSGTTNTGNNNSNVFDYGDNSLTRSSNMFRARWYSSATVMINGEVYIQGGNGGGDLPEVRRLDGTFRLLSNAPTGPYATVFPRNFLAPDGRVFGYDTNGKMYFVATGGTGSLIAAGQIASANAGWTSSAAMYRPGRILQIGGNSNGAVIIDINGPQPTVTTTQSMSSRRQWVSATVLADGKVLGTGGSQNDNQMVGVNNSAEIWDPATGEWHVGTSGVKARLYHSAGLLLPDASVLVSGGGAPGPQVNTNAEIYYPPYLFDGNGDLAARPFILSAPDTAEVGDVLDIEIDASTISAINLVKTGSVTHSVNMDQRFLTIPFTRSGNMLQASLPNRATDTPPGYYLMFVLDGNGVPSHARMLRINIDATPFVAVDYTPAIGGGGGGAFQLACPADETLVGVHGRYATYVNQVGPKCVKVDQLGRWIGNPTDGPVTGTSTSGTAFSKVCPVNFAVSGFRGRSAQYVDQVELECRALTPSGGLTGVAQYLGGSGGSGGSAQGPLSCGTGNPAYALYGRSGSWLDAFGMQCRQAVITPISINSSPVIVNPGTQSGIVGIAAGLQISASDGDGDDLTFSAIGLPSGLQLDSASGFISGTPSVANSFNASVTVSDGSESDTADFTWNIVTAAPLAVDPVPSQPPQLVDTQVAYFASANGGVNVVFKWDFGDGTPETAFSSNASAEHVFAEPGIYFVTLTVNDDFGIPIIQTFVQTVYLPLTTSRPANSSNVMYETRSGANSRVWAVNQDNDTVTVIDAVTNQKLAEIAVGEAPRSVAAAPDGRVWVTSKAASAISIVDPISLAVVQSLSLPRGSAPYGIVFSPVSNEAYVTLEAKGQLLKLDATTGLPASAADVGANPRQIAVNSTGTKLYISRFITPRQPGEETATVLAELSGTKFGGEVLLVDPSTMTVTGNLILQHSEKPDAENQGSGVPNYLGAATISPDGTHAWLPSKQDNIGRGTLRNGLNINFQNTVRAVSSRIDVIADAEDYASRIDHDDASVASAAVFDPYGVYMFVSLETSREIAVIDVHGGYQLFRLDTGMAPQGLVVSPDGLKLFVNNFMSRTVGIYDIAPLQQSGLWSVPLVATVQSVAIEKLAADVLRGKQLFYDARDIRLARDRYLSCATCHNDGGQDGRVWDLTGMGEGLRNTIALNGRRGGQGFLHWSENFDEVQDFEGQIRSLSEGTGLMSNADFNHGSRSQPLGDPKAGLSADLDALAAYVESLDEFAASPYRNEDNSLTADAVAGREIFRSENCAACHGGTDFTDSGGSNLHDIGTIKSSSGSRLNGPLSGIDTPTLRGVWNGQPYLHDGSAATMHDAVEAHIGMTLDAQQLAQLVAYLSQIDGTEAAAPVPNVPPTIDNPGSQANIVGESVSLALVAQDVDGDQLTFNADGLPAGLGIDALTGEVSGVPTSGGQSMVTVTTSDGIDSASTVFEWSISSTDNSKPSRPKRLKAKIVDGFVQLTWDASTDNVGIAGYYVFRSTDGTQGIQIATTVNTAWLDQDVIEGTTYTYSVMAFDEAGNFSRLSGMRSQTPFMAPTRPSDLAWTVAGGYPQLEWTASTDNVGVVGYIILRSDGVKTEGPQVGQTTETSWIDTSVTSGVKYFYAVKAYDAVGNFSARSPFITVVAP